MMALDVDGTIVDGDNVMSEAVREAVRAAWRAGIHIVISTGRSMPGVVNAIDKIGMTDGLAVASNGAVVFSYDPPKVLHAVTFDASHAVQLVLEKVPDAMVAVEELGVGYRVNKPFSGGEINGQIKLESIYELIAQPVTRVIIRAPEHSREAFSAMVYDLGLEGTNYYIGYTAWLDLAPEGVSKASGLDLVCSELGIGAADVLAIGDGLNDLEMIEWAGRGVVMGHAPDQLKALADHVTGDIHSDGAATEIRRYL